MSEIPDNLVRQSSLGREDEDQDGMPTFMKVIFAMFSMSLFAVTLVGLITVVALSYTSNKHDEDQLRARQQRELARLYGERTEAAYAKPLLINMIRFEAAFYRDHGRFADLEEGRSVTQTLVDYENARKEQVSDERQGEMYLLQFADADDAGLTFTRQVKQARIPLDRYGDPANDPEVDYRLNVNMGKDDDGELAHTFSCEAPSWDKAFCPTMTRVVEDLKIKRYAADDSDLNFGY